MLRILLVTTFVVCNVCACSHDASPPATIAGSNTAASTGKRATPSSAAGGGSKPSAAGSGGATPARAQSGGASAPAPVAGDHGSSSAGEPADEPLAGSSGSPSSPAAGSGGATGGVGQSATPRAGQGGGGTGSARGASGRGGAGAGAAGAGAAGNAGSAGRGGAGSGGAGSGSAPPSLCSGARPASSAFAASPAALDAKSSERGAPDARTNPGAAAPRYRLRDFQPLSCGYNAAYGLETFRGRPTLVALFAAWCPYCREQVGKLEQMALELEAAGKPVYIVIVNMVDAADMQAEFVNRVSLPLLQDIPEVDAFALHGGAKDDLFIYRSDGTLQVYLPNYMGPISVDLTTQDGYEGVKSFLASTP